MYGRLDQQIPSGQFSKHQDAVYYQEVRDDEKDHLQGFPAKQQR
jgi:hypothetical protein